jgi:hypothetical protein
MPAAIPENICARNYLDEFCLLAHMMPNSHKRQYLFGALFVAFGAYQAWTGDYLECALYVAAGTAFMGNALIAEPALMRWKKWLIIADWALIIATSLLFLFVIRYRYL